MPIRTDNAERDAQRPIIVHSLAVLIQVGTRCDDKQAIDTAWAVYDFFGQPKELIDTYAGANEIIDVLMSERNKAQDQLRAARRALDEQTRRKFTARSEYDLLKEAHATVVEGTARLARDLKEAREFNTHYAQQHVEQREQIARQATTIRSFRTDLDAAHATIVDMHNAMASVINERDAMIKQCTKLRGRLERRHHVIMSLVNSRDSIVTERNDTVQTQHAAIRSRDVVIAKLNGLIDEARKEVMASRDNVSTALATIKKIRAERDKQADAEVQAFIDDISQGIGHLNTTEHKREIIKAGLRTLLQGAILLRLRRNKPTTVKADAATVIDYVDNKSPGQMTGLIDDGRPLITGSAEKIEPKAHIVGIDPAESKVVMGRIITVADKQINFAVEPVAYAKIAQFNNQPCWAALFIDGKQSGPRQALHITFNDGNLSIDRTVDFPMLFQGANAELRFSHLFRAHEWLFTFPIYDFGGGDNITLAPTDKKS